MEKTLNDHISEFSVGDIITIIEMDEALKILENYCESGECEPFEDHYVIDGLYDDYHEHNHKDYIEKKIMIEHITLSKNSLEYSDISGVCMEDGRHLCVFFIALKKYSTYNVDLL